MHKSRYLNSANCGVSQANRRPFGLYSSSAATFLTWMLAAFAPLVVVGQTFDERFEDWPLKLKIRGKVVVVNEMDANESLARHVLRGRNEAKVLTVLLDKSMEATAKKLGQHFKEQSIVSADDDKTVEQLNRSDIALILGTVQGGKAEGQALLRLKAPLHRLVERGGCVLVQGKVAEWIGHTTVDGEAGLDLVTDGVLQLAPLNDKNRLRSRLVLQPRRVGLILEEKSAFVLSGRLLYALGSGSLTAVVAANEREPFLVKQIRERQSPRQNRQTFMIDLTQWRRIAIDRELPEFPPKEPPKPFVDSGTLLIVGGGGLPKGLMERLVELAGGNDKAKMVYIPCSQRDALPARQRMVQSWKRMGVKHATFIHTKDRNKANTDEAILAPLRDATGLWFGGGRQWNFADSYYGARAHQLMKEVLKRGGVIGGSSAGASVQGRYLARATPINNFDIMAPGYERGGLGFLGGVAIDQHFSQRRRQKDMTQLVNKHPQLLGIGIDEGTAIIVQKSIAEVVGRGKVYFYDRRQPVYPDRPDYIALPAGSKYDLAQRKVLVDATNNQASGQ